MMKRAIMLFAWMTASCAGVWAQDVLYPFLGNSGFEATRIQPSPNQPDRRSFVAEKNFEYKITIGFPSDDQAMFLRDSHAPVIVLWLKVENLSQKPIALKTEEFTVTDEAGKSYPRLAPQDAYDRIAAGSPVHRKLLSKSLRGVTLGKVAGKSDEENEKDEAVRFSLASQEIPAYAMKQGYLFFEAPTQRDFKVNVKLGSLWSQSFVFTNVKQK